MNDSYSAEKHAFKVVFDIKSVSYMVIQIDQVLKMIVYKNSSDVWWQSG